MTNFSGGGLEIKEGSSKPGKLMKPGVQVAMISDVEYFEASTGSKGLKLILMTKPVEGLVDENKKPMGQKCTETMWMSPKAWDNNGNPADANWCTKARLHILCDKLGVLEQFQAIEAANEEDFINKLKPLLVGKKARFAVGGEESSFENDEGETIKVVYPFLLTFGFVESLEDVPEDANTKLKYDETNKNHYKPMEVADSVEEDATVPGEPATSDDVDW